MATQFDKFIATMKKVLMLDQADLDFGIYRIMNRKRDQIESYLNNDLRRQVAEAISENASNDAEALQKELAKLVSTLTEAGMNPDNAPKVQELKERIARCGNSEGLENEVYSHLSIFFGRYYDGGDFVSQRRYKKDVYAIPYEGEEVKLYWANADQYYIKTAEYFRNYRFAVDGDKFCEFTLREATTEQNNNVAQNNMERRFALCKETPIEVIGDTLHIYFTYELYPKATKQKALVEAAFDAIKNAIPAEFISVLAPRPTESDRTRTLLQKHLNDYVARNTFDYFIHKDLGGFLSRELDFYIKNEILVIDDINARTPGEFLKHLTVIKAIKMVGMKLITFLASLENYQKRLWLKKKFVIESNYCMTLDRVPESLYAEIAANDAQREEWVRLFAIDGIERDQRHTAAYTVPLSVEFLKENPFLVLDTKFFTAEFRNTLLASIDNIDEQCDGLLINSENFQALELLQEKYREQVKCIYIDPPYNTGPSKIIYKNNFQNSSWLALMDNRLNLGYNLIDEASCLCVAIDDFEMANLAKLLDANLLGYKRDMIVVNHHPQGTPKENVSRTHEYAIILSPKGENVMKNEGELENEELRPLMRSGSADNNYRHGRWKSFYAILVDPETKEIKGYEEPPILGSEYPTENTIEGWQRIYPIGKNGDERVWRISSDSKKLQTNKIWELVKASKTGTLYQIITNKKEPINSNWTDKRYNAGTYGTTVIANMFGDSSVFTYPKSLYTVQDYIESVTESFENDIVLDFFAGSGTTGHAVINLNRKDQGKRKYILCEMGEYFDTVTKPRIQKVIYSKDWDGGKPVSREGSSHCFKYMRLEQYEDTLNNLTIEPANISKDNVDFYGGYMLGYMLDIETRDSLFNMQWFRNPWNMKLRIIRQNETREENIDVIETFNYLIGLNVTSILHPRKGVCTVEGVTRRGERTLVIWRDCDTVDNDALNDFFRRMSYSTRDTEFDRIYVNGDNNLENLRTDEEQWKVVLTEQEFAKRMFEDC